VIQEVLYAFFDPQSYRFYLFLTCNVDFFICNLAGDSRSD